MMGQLVVLSVCLTVYNVSMQHIVPHVIRPSIMTLSQHVCLVHRIVQVVSMMLHQVALLALSVKQTMA